MVDRLFWVCCVYGCVWFTGIWFGDLLLFAVDVVFGDCCFILLICDCCLRLGLFACLPTCLRLFWMLCVCG